ncbi:hypothetical protein SAMD00023353_0403580 [Rosellinia necatrix]|uniref:Transposase Tc1-like domain-containing protein n=1 Tax=Rosellinia necatrix TaxID=77044 RepID=A0A1W2TW98_ROSNE|nr:hypothetical protein SAMD00023353_0403580 [Rosellinia necatrix]
MGREFDMGTRIQALTLHSEGYSRRAIAERTGYTTNGLSYLVAKAKRRGYKPGQGPILREYAETEPGKGRPTILTEERKSKIIAILTADAASRKFSAREIADKFHEQNGHDRTISRTSVRKALAAEGYKTINRTYKSQPAKRPAKRPVKQPAKCSPHPI